MSSEKCESRWFSVRLGAIHFVVNHIIKSNEFWISSSRSVFGAFFALRAAFLCIRPYDAGAQCLRPRKLLQYQIVRDSRSLTSLPIPAAAVAPAHGVLYSTRATLQLDSNYIWTMLLRQTFRNCILGCSSSSRFFRYPLGSFTASRQKRASRTHEESRVWERLAKRMGTHLPPTLQRLNTSRQSFNLSNVKSPQTAKRTHSSFDKSRGGGYI